MTKNNHKTKTKIKTLKNEMSLETSRDQDSSLENHKFGDTRCQH